MAIRKIAWAGAFAALALAQASPLLAHTRLVASAPAANATLRAGPNSISLTFSEKVVPGFSKLTVTMPAHGMTIPVKSSVSPDGKRLMGALAKPLVRGSYKVVWTAASADGHKMSGEFSFKVE